MNFLNGLEPRSFFRFFEEISAIPRGSGNTAPIAEYLVSFAKKRGLDHMRDDHDNVIIKKPAQGKSISQDAVIIQGHTDMVTVAKAGKEKDFQNDGIDLLIKGDHIYADGTSLGADDGVAVCYALAVLDDKDITHPPIEAVFTSNEETGLLGAGDLDISLLSGKTFLNIDSEDDGIFFAGCAGGATCRISADISPEMMTGTIIELELSGLKGGHSGMEIDKQRANANKILGSAVFKLLSRHDDMRLISFNGGEKENAIAAFARAELLVAESNSIPEISLEFDDVMEHLMMSYNKTDPGYEYTFAYEEDKCEESPVIPKDTGLNITGLLEELEDGVISMSEEVPDVVETSANTGVTRINVNRCEITVSVRSLVNEKRDERADTVKELAGDVFDVNVSEIYSGWSYAPDSYVREVLMEEYRTVTGKEPRVEVIHAGLECGVFAEKMPGVDFVSFGPQADDIHTFNERLSISSVKDYWQILVNTLSRL